VLGLRAPAALLALAASLFAAATVGWEYYRGVRARMRSTGESPPVALARLVGRARSRYGGYIVHLGVVMIAVGVVCSSSFQIGREASMPVGGSMTIGRYTITNQGIEETRVPGSRTVTARLLVTEPDGSTRTVLPGKVFYENFNDQPATHVAIETDNFEDLYLVLAAWGNDGTISLAAFVNPMVLLIWLGGGVLLFGTFVTLWPERMAAPQPLTVPRREMLGVEA
jgi:cytochrome c-type biogenesis protein CcmF